MNINKITQTVNDMYNSNISFETLPECYNYFGSFAMMDYISFSDEEIDTLFFMLQKKYENEA